MLSYNSGVFGTSGTGKTQLVTIFCKYDACNNAPFGVITAQDENSW